MAIIKVYIEGGVVQHANDSVATVHNSQRIREAFYRLFIQKLGHFDFRLEIEMSGGWAQTRSNWLSSLQAHKNTFLLIDLDFLPGEEKKRLKQLGIEQQQYNLVFFMTREMEAWFLDQPEVFEKAFAHLKRVRGNDKIGEDPSILGKDIRSIPKPSNLELVRESSARQKRGQFAG